jgi:hypothetical protein
MSRDYAKVSSAFWTGKTGRALRGDPAAQLVGMYLITCQHANMIGAFNCPAIFVAHETGMALDEVLKALQRLTALGFCEYDAAEELVWICEMAKYQIGETLKKNDKRVGFIIKEFKKLPESKIKDEFYTKYKDSYFLPENVTKPIAPSPFEAPSKPLRSQELELEQELEQELKDTSPGGDVGELADATPTAPRSAVVKAFPDCPYQAIQALYHEMLPELRQCRDLDSVRKGYIRQRWRDSPGADLAKWRTYFGYVRESGFLMGKKSGTGGRPPFEADLEWLIKPRNFLAICEGKYHEVSAHG